MGFDCGFDIYPRLEPTAENTQAYGKFLEEIIHTYGEAYDQDSCREDGIILEMPSGDSSKGIYVRFMVGYGCLAILNDATTFSASAPR